MRTFTKLHSLVAIAAGAAALAAGTISFTANGATIQQRLVDPAGMIITGDNPVPVQQVIGDCGATCALTAQAGTVQTLNVWGFRTSTGTVNLPGPTIVVNQGDEVSIAVTNSLPLGAGDLKLELPSVAASDVHTSPTIGTGVTDSVTFKATQVGTSIYRASASTPRGNLQVAMGLAGVLIVRPTTCPVVPLGGCAYDDLVGDFDDEALLATNDLDPNLATAPDPLLFDMTDFDPTYHLINGKVFPDTEVIDTQAGHRVLIRYANLGLSDHSMGLSGTRQLIVGRDSNPLVHASSDVVVPLNVGQTVDAIVTVPTDAKATYRYALSDQVLQPGANSAAPAMTFLTVWQSAGFTTTETLTSLEPLVTVARSAETTANLGGGDVQIDYDLTVSNTGADASYSLDEAISLTPGMVADSVAATVVSGAGAAVSAGFDGGATTLLVSGATVTGADPHVFHISIVGHFADVAGPIAQINSITPDLSAGATDLVIGGTITIPSGVVAATGGTFSIDDPGAALLGGSPNALTSVDAFASTFEGIVPAAELSHLANGTHILWVQLTDGSSAYGDPTGIGFSIDRAGPVVRPVELDPAYTNGSVEVSIRATADASLTGSDEVVQGNASIDTCPDYTLQPVAGPGNYLLGINAVQAIAEVSGTIPSAYVAGLSEGTHTVHVAAVDSRGVWSNDGASLPASPASLCGSADLVVDFTDPTTVSASTDPSGPNDGTLGYNGVENFLEVVRIFATVNDGVSGVGKVEGFIDTVEAEGTGFLFSPVDGEFGPLAGNEDVYADIPLSSVRSLTPGNHPIYIRAQDKAGNWGTATAPTFLDIVSALPQVTTVTYDSSGPGGTLAVTGTAYGVGVTIAAIEYRVGLTSAGPFTPMTFTGGAVATATLTPRPTIPPGDNLWVRVQNSLGQWSAVYQLLP